MAALSRDYGDFKRGVIFSVSVHLALIILIMISPHFPKTSSKGMTHYVNVISFPGGGGPGGGGGSGGGPGGGPGGGGQGEQTVATPVPARERLSDLSTPQKLIQQEPASMRFPVDKPKRERTPPAEKKAVIQRQQNTTSAGTGAESSGGAAGSGGGLRMGIGGGGGGGWGGVGSSYSSQIGLSTFPYTYYLQTIHSRISNNWYTSQVRAGVSGEYHTTVYFKIMRDGRIDGLKVEEASGIRALDLSARRAIESSAPFPPLPRDYEDEYLGIHLIFEHSP